MLTSEAINEVSAALAKAQAEIQNPPKDSTNPHFKSSYADIASGLNATRPALTKNGLAIIQATSMDGDLLMLETRIVHSSGQWVGSIYPVCKFPAQQQQMGSALTYSRRYALFALVGIAGEDDDDGTEATKTPIPAQPKRHYEQNRRSEPVNDDPFSDPAPGPDDAREYVASFGDALSAFTSASNLDNFWRNEAKHRAACGVIKGSAEYDDCAKMFKKCKATLENRDAA